MSFILNSEGVVDDYMLDKYGKYCDPKEGKVGKISLPLRWKGAPEKTKNYALVMMDYDSIPVAGFAWIHWIAIIPGDVTELKENASFEDERLIQGVNSSVSKSFLMMRAVQNFLPRKLIKSLQHNFSKKNEKIKDESSCYTGPAPPDKEHTYVVTLYALDCELNLDQGFYLNELYDKMEGHILAKTSLKGKYRS